jgi:CP family cyanate transporter-like MFS transporter
VLSMIVRLRAPHRPALATGSYASGIVLGATVAAWIAVPLAGPDGDWRFALAVFSLAAVGSLLAWIALVPAESAATRVDARPLRLPWGSSTAWALAAVFGLQSLLFYAAAAWLPNVYVERGWSQAEGANLLALAIGLGLVSTIGVPLFADRIGSRRAQLLAAAAVTLVAVVGFTVAGELGVAWAVLFGLGSGALFPLALTLPVDLSDDAAEVGATAALMLMAGYVLSALGPVGVGVVRDLTGDFTASLWTLVGLTVVLVLACAVLSPGRMRRGVGRGATR